MKFLKLALFAYLIPTSTIAQIGTQTTAASDRWQAFENRKFSIEQSISKNLPVTNIGPTVFGGRIVDIEVNPNDPAEFYLAYASGGLWHTSNNGSSYTPLFDAEAVMTIGDIAVDWNNKLLYIGTGENNSSRSSYSGMGLFKSSNLGKTWKHIGLDESHHIGRIALHPQDTNVIYVAVLGKLYSSNDERGVYQTSDGGNTWKQSLFINNQTGAIDILVHPNTPNVIYTAMWTRERKSWHFDGCGNGSGVFLSEDNGMHWNNITPPQLRKDSIGRIGLALYASQDTSLLYILVDNLASKNKEIPKDELSRDALRTMLSSDFIKLPAKQIKQFLKKENFPEMYSVDTVLMLVKSNVIKPSALVEYLEDSNSQLFNTDVIGAEIYVTDNKGISWRKTHAEYLDGLYFTYGYYFGQIRVNPNNRNHIIVMGVPILQSMDGGSSFKNINGANVHVDHHALWINPQNGKHLINGNDGGLNISYDGGESWHRGQQPSVGQFYFVNYDLEQPYNVYGGTQDNGVWVGKHNYSQSSRWQSVGNYPYQSLIGGDGMQIGIDTRSHQHIYTGFQFGNYFRIDKQSGKQTRITPAHKLGSRPYRWNWQSPILLSQHNQDIIYFGANVLFRSMDKGNTFKEISPDLTQGNKFGNVAFGTLTCISESQLHFGLIYTGSDDGLVYVSKDGGANWSNISEGLPANLWVSRIVASQHNKARVYLTLNGYRNDNFTSYIYVSEDYGEHWEAIHGNIQHEAVNVICEDPVNPNLLFVGTDHGVYYSLDKGKHYSYLSKQLPFVPVHDLKIHPVAKDLIIGTHGRSIYIADIEAFEKLDSNLLQQDVFVFSKKVQLKFDKNWGKKVLIWDSQVSKPIVTIESYSKLEKQDLRYEYWFENILLTSGQFSLQRGLNYSEINLKVDIPKLSEYQKMLHKQQNLDEIPVVNIQNKLAYPLPGQYQLRIFSQSQQKFIDIIIK